MPPFSFFLNVIFGGSLFSLMPNPRARPMSLLSQRQRVEADNDDVAGSRGGDDLPAASLAVLRALDDAGIQQLNLRAAVPDHAGDARQRRELVRRHLGEGARQLVEQRGLPHGRKPMPTRQSPVLVTSNPSPFGPDLAPDPSMRSRRSLASFALSDPRWRRSPCSSACGSSPADRRDLLHDVRHLSVSLLVCVCTGRTVAPRAAPYAMRARRFFGGASGSRGVRGTGGVGRETF